MAQKVLRFFVILLTIAILATNVFIFITTQGGFHNWIVVLESATAVAALMYVFGGFRKSFALFFKAYLVIYILMLAERLYYLIRLGNSPLYIAISVLAVISAIVLAVVPNLGKVKSCLLVAFNLLVDAVHLVLLIVTNAELSFYGLCILEALMTISLLVMTIGKYIDKQARGTT